jgi:hypothetical protein
MKRRYKELLKQGEYSKLTTIVLRRLLLFANDEQKNNIETELNKRKNIK